MTETKDNPLVTITMQFQDGCQLGLRMDHPVPQVQAMAALGHFAAEVGMPKLNITLPVAPVELVTEALDHFLSAYYPLEPRRSQGLWSSHEMAKAILDAVLMPDPEMVDACRVAAQAIRDDMPHVALLPLATAIANYDAKR